MYSWIWANWFSKARYNKGILNPVTKVKNRAQTSGSKRLNKEKVVQLQKSPTSNQNIDLLEDRSWHYSSKPASCK